MFTAVIAILALGATLWGLFSQVQREEARTLLLVNAAWLTRWVIALALLTIGYPIVTALAIAWCGRFAGLSPLAEAIGHLILILAILPPLWLLWRRRSEWTKPRIYALRLRMDELLQSDNPSTAVALVARVAATAGTTDEPDTSGLADLLLRALLSPHFIRAALREQPSLIGRLLPISHAVVLESSDRILDEAFAGADRHLAKELSRCVWFRSDRLGYEIPPDCPLLGALLNDASVAERLHAWKPIGEAMLRDLTGRSGTDPDNAPYEGDFDERDRWQSAVGSGLWFFRVMVTEALRQGIRWHMWLYYLPHFVEQMLANVRVDKSAEDSEYPNRYLFLVADCLRMLHEVVTTSSRLPPENPHRGTVSPSAGHDNASIPKSSLIAYVYCLRHVLASPNVPTRFRSDRVESAAQLFRILESPENAPGLVEAFVAILAEQHDTRDQLESLLEAAARQELHHDEYRRLLEKIRAG